MSPLGNAWIFLRPEEVDVGGEEKDQGWICNAS